MRIEDLQAQLYGAGTLAHGYVVVWNGTRDSASGTPYLDSHEVPAVADAPPREPESVPPFKSALRCAVVAALEAHGPMTIRALTDHLHGSLEAVKQCVYNMVKGGYLVEYGAAAPPVKQFGRGRPSKLFGVAS